MSHFLLWLKRRCSVLCSSISETNEKFFHALETSFSELFLGAYLCSGAHVCPYVSVCVCAMSMKMYYCIWHCACVSISTVDDILRSVEHPLWQVLSLARSSPIRLYRMVREFQGFLCLWFLRLWLYVWHLCSNYLPSLLIQSLINESKNKYFEVVKLCYYIIPLHCL